MKMHLPREILQIVQNSNLRWRDDPKGMRIAQRLLRNPNDEYLQQRFEKRYGKKLRNFMASNDVFFGNYPSPGTLPAFTRGRIPLCALPTRDILSIDAEALRRNMLVCGPSGGGKTNFLRGTIRAILEAGGTVVAFDRKGKAELADCGLLIGCRDNLPSPLHVWKWEELRLAPLQPVEGVSLGYWANLVTSTLASQWSLIASTTLLMEIIHSFFAQHECLTWDRLVGKAVSFKAESYRSEAYRDVIIRNLKSVYYAFNDVINAAESNVIDILTRESGCHIILTNGLIAEHASLLTAFFLIRDYEYRRIHEEAQTNLTCYILDDSMALVKTQSNFEEGTTINPLNTIAFMGRSLGLSLIVSAQNFSHISSFFTQNCDSVVVCGAQGEDCYSLRRYLNLNDEQAACLPVMLPGEVCVLAHSAWGKAVMGKYPLFE